MKRTLLFVITLYQYIISPILLVVFGHACRYPLTCSDYTKEAIEKYGMIKGIKMGMRRIASCHPWSHNYV